MKLRKTTRKTSVEQTLLTAKQTANFLSLAEHTLAVWRLNGRCKLPYLKLGGAIRYRKSDVLRFLEESVRVS